MERYTTLWKTAQNLYATNSPVVISAGALVKDNETDKILVQLKFRNISDALIKAIKIEIIPYSVDNNELSAKTEFQYLDLTAAYNTEFGQKTPVFLPDNTTRAFKVICKSVVFVNGAKWENTDNTVFEPTDYPQGIRNRINTTNNFIRFIDFATKEDIKDNTNIFWQHHDKEKIITQKNELSDFLTYTTGELYIETNELISKYTAILTAERKADEEFSEDELNTIKCYNEIKSKLKEEKSRILENKSKKNKKAVKTVTIVTSATVAFLTVFCIIYSTLILPAINYNKAITFMENGQFQNAIAIFEALDGYKDSETYLIETQNKQNEATTEKAYNEAIEYFNIHTNTLYAKNIKNNAVELFNDIIDYKDSRYYVNYINGKYNEQYSISKAYNYYVNIPADFLDVDERIQLIKKYLPYTGTYTYSHGGNSYNHNDTINVFINIDPSNAATNNDRVLISYYENGNGLTLSESDNSLYNYMFIDSYYETRYDNFKYSYISETTLCLYKLNEGEIYFTKEIPRNN